MNTNLIMATLKRPHIEIIAMINKTAIEIVNFDIYPFDRDFSGCMYDI